MRTLCFGEAIVDLICRQPVGSLADADAFVPSPGGVSANVAAAAALHGAHVSLAGGAGDDPWGIWLRDRLTVAGVDLRWFALAGGHATPVAFVTVDERGEPTWQLYGDGVAAIADAIDGRLPAAVEATDALFFTSNTLAAPATADLTMAARERALELGRPVVFDPSLRLHRWRANPGRAGTMSSACVPGAFLVKCNQEEARLMTGESDPEAAAASLLAAGAQHVIVTLGLAGAILRAHGMRLDVQARPARVRSTLGAGDVFLGVLIARLDQTDYYPSALAAGLSQAAEEAARACERWGALE
ncbi:MAG TPA: PfkB family carbohydrate kinase [Solirubrobacteraceae bacterium]|nr:PfkB family carbohydrate kinase [Solirubrobacteraceae bacterium]